jgi:transcriptional regulator with XRE-family HTH domain
MSTWSERITDLEGLGWSLTELGKAIGLSAQSVSDIKCGRTAEPRGMAAVRLHRLHEIRRPPRRLGRSLPPDTHSEAA